MADFVAADTNSKLRISLTKKSDSTALDLTGATVNLKWKIGAGSLTTSAMTITDAAGGVCEYLFTSGQLVAGTMYVEAEITSAAKVVTTLEIGTFVVRAKLT